ncbi:hypothetical protein TR631_12415 [Streptomyces rochei]|uniref:hypothetical protein n=1 Tax=Streptomyces TaxID=1883 RepID=UPI00163B8096|nr:MULTISPECIES: hypothetical protein [Streptomyces]WQC12571.1 hypothetical protein TR631_12415 [Streptomyces rochei]
MPATAGSVSVDCPECGDKVVVELRVRALPCGGVGEPHRIELEPDFIVIRQHIDEVHA